MLWCCAAIGNIVLTRSGAAHNAVAPFAGDKPGARHSQCNQDCVVLALLQLKRDGFFVDLAANDGLYMSNTWALERYYGWDGVCIEG